MLVGKIILYFLYDLAKRGMKYFSGTPDYKDEVKKVLDSISNNKKVMDDISKIFDLKRGIDSGTADSIVKMAFVQSTIKKLTDSNTKNIDKTELENQLKTILVKSWSDMGDKAVEKVKNDIK